MDIVSIRDPIPERYMLHMLHMLHRVSRAVPQARVVAALTVGLAGLIHLALSREHFEEQVAYGLAFTMLAVFQLGLALLLVTRPGPRVHQAGICGSGLTALVYVATRLVPPPGSSAPEELDGLGIAATGFELAAVVLLALALPDYRVMRPRVSPGWWGVGGGLLSAPLWLVATGSIQWTSAPVGAPPVSPRAMEGEAGEAALLIPTAFIDAWVDAWNV
jgi:hypothetical protein